MDKLIPTQEQIKEFWEWYGFKQTDVPIDIRNWHKRTDIYMWFEPDATGISPMLNSLPPIDLNNLFRYAVPKEKLETVQFSWGDDGCHCWLYTKKNVGKPYWGSGPTEDIALFWALWQVKESHGK